MQGKNKIRIFHTGDVHLDSPFSRMDQDKGALRRRELRTVFSSMMMEARMRHADLVLIAGDLFDTGYAGEDTVNFLISEFCRAPECKFVISPGNHDPYNARSVYRLKKFPDNVFIFDKPTLDVYRFPALGVSVWGWAFTSDKLEENPLRDAHAEEDGNIPLLCCHCDLRSSASPYAPVSTGDIERFGAVYSALGHVHGKMLGSFGRRAAYSYCGCPEGRSFDEPGIGGAVWAEITRTETGCCVETEFIPFAGRRYECETVDLCGVLFRSEAEEKIRARLKEKGYGGETSLRLRLTGMTGVGIGRLDDFRAEDLGLFYLETEDRTTPDFDADSLRRDMTLRGAFYRLLEPMLESENEEDRLKARDALRAGLSALAGNEIGR